MSAAETFLSPERQALLGALLPGERRLPEALPDGDLCTDSRLVTPGDIFLALPGFSADGRQYIGEALDRGAALVLAEACEGLAAHDRVLAVSDLSKELPSLARDFYQDPSSTMNLLAVTGTNGKTSVVEFSAHLLRAIGLAVGCIGTLGSRTEAEPVAAANTTPDILALTRQLRSWRDRGVEHVAMEASSHALAQGRMSGLRLHSACFTNLSRDHLDYHGTLQRYATAKLSLFTDFNLASAIYNADDPVARRVAELADTETLSVSLVDRNAHVFVEVVDPRRFVIALATPWGHRTIAPSLCGQFNAFNVAAAIACVVSMGFDFDRVCAAAEGLQPIPGRMERFTSETGCLMVVDYAHTPDALENSLRALRSETPGRLWAVFGCGGDRDAGKRPQMGKVATQLADRIIVTSDNPRSEDPAAIAREVVSVCDNRAEVVLDRAAAIRLAVANALPGDTVLIAGKGHENYQETAGVRVPFDDRAILRQELGGKEEVS